MSYIEYLTFLNTRANSIKNEEKITKIKRCNKELKNDKSVIFYLCKHENSVMIEEKVDVYLYENKKEKTLLKIKRMLKVFCKFW